MPRAVLLTRARPTRSLHSLLDAFPLCDFEGSQAGEPPPGRVFSSRTDREAVRAFKSTIKHRFWSAVPEAGTRLPFVEGRHRQRRLRHRVNSVTPSVTSRRRCS